MGKAVSGLSGSSKGSNRTFRLRIRSKFGLVSPSVCRRYIVDFASASETLQKIESVLVFTVGPVISDCTTLPVSRVTASNIGFEPVVAGDTKSEGYCGIPLTNAAVENV